MASDDQEKIPCEQCKKHIPKSAAVTFEGADYTFHFCCPKCLDYWKKDHKIEEEK